MKSKTILFICIIFFISNVFGVTISMAPPVTNIKISQGETGCKEIFLESDYPVEVFGRDLWINNKSNRGNIKKYNLSSEELNLQVTYLQNTSVVKNRTIRLCAKAKDFGNYSGVLLYRVKNKPIQIGSWIEVFVEDGSEIRMEKIATSKLKGVRMKNVLKIFPVVLLSFLLALVWLLRRK